MKTILFAFLLSLPACLAADLGDLPEELGADSDELQVNCPSGPLEEARQACEKTCPDQVKNAYGSGYGWTCLAQQNCTYTCYAIPPKAPATGPKKD